MINTSFTSAEIEQRQQEILSKPPRIEPKFTDGIIRASQEHVAKLRTTGGNTSAPADPESIPVDAIPEMIVTLMGCHPKLYEKVADVSVALMAKSSLPRRDLELAVLRTDWLCQSPYNWGEHAVIAKRFGITEEEIERVTRGSDAAGWTEHDKALMRAAEELHDVAMISDETWSVLVKSFSEKQLFELIVLVGQFTLVTYFQNSLRFRVAGDSRGLMAR